MKRLLFAITFFLSLSSYGQDWLELYNQSVSSYNNFENEAAKEQAKQALESYNATIDNPDKNKAAILRQLVLITSENGELEAAISYAKEEIELLEKIGAEKDMYFANALNNMAVLHSAKSEYAAAKPLLEEALKISLQYNSAESPEVAQFKGNLAITLFHTKDDEKALQYFEESILVLDQLEAPPFDFYNILYEYASLLASKGNYDDALNSYYVLEDYYSYDAPNYEYAGILIKSGDALDNLGKTDEAIAKYNAAIENLEAIGETESVDYAIAQNNLSIDLQKKGQFSEARELVEKLLEVRKEKIESSPEAYVVTAANYGNLLLRSGEIAKAESYIDEVIELYDSYDITKNISYLNTLESKSKIDLLQGDLDTSLETIDKAITFAESVGFDSNLYSLYNQKSRVLLADTKYEEAKSAGKKALTLAQEIFGNSSLATAYVQNSLAGIYTELGKYEQAEKLYASALPSFERNFGKEHPEYATCAANYSSLLQQQGKYYKAESYLLEAVETKKNALGEDNLDYLSTLENLGLLYYNTARYTDAERTISTIKSKKEALLDSDDPTLAYTYTNLANIKKQTAEYPEAEKYFNKAESILAKSIGKDHIQYAGTINSLALLYQKMGNVSSAKPLFENALVIYEKKLGKNSPDYATVLENLATLYQMEENYEKARELLKEALVIDETILGKNHPLYSKTLHNLASLYEQDEDYETARALYEQSLDIDREIYGENHPSYASTLYNLAVLEQELEDFEQAKIHYEKVAEIRKNILGESHPDYAYSVYGLASINQRLGNYEIANSNYQIVIEKYLSNIREYFPALSESEKSDFYSKIRPVFEAYMDFAVDYVRSNQGTVEKRTEVLCQLYDLQLSTKALLLNATNKVRNRIMNSGDQELIDLFQSWIALKENIVKSLSLSREEIEQNNIDIPAMQAEANALEKELSLKSSAFSQEFEKKEITWKAVSENLKENEAAIEIIRIKKNLKNDSVLYATLILQNVAEAGPRLTVIANGDELESKAFKNYKNAIVFKVTDKNSYAQYWKQIDKQLDGVSNIYLSADGVYNKVNISTLMDENKKYIVDKYNIRLLSNTRELIDVGEKVTVPDYAELFGFPAYNLDNVEKVEAPLVDQGGLRYSFGENVSELPGTLEEIKNISAVMAESGWQMKVHTGADASEGDIKSLKSPKIFHVATHGFFLEDIQIDENSGESLSSRSMKYNPLMRSGLLFAGAENSIRKEDIPGEEDGILTAYEAMNLDLDNTELVVMSACETGLGEVKNGEGVYGLQRSFLVAGADNLIMSLWKVNDETTQLLMSTFYREWIKGTEKTEAFNKAIQEVKSKYSEPFYWGAFVMLGK